MARRTQIDYVEVLVLVVTYLQGYAKKHFTVSEFYSWYVQARLVIYPDKPIPSKKVVSNEMAKLYRMGFLSRKPKPRKVRTKSGKVANRGIEYVYSLTKQGMKYYNYLIERMSLGKGEVLESWDRRILVELLGDGLDTRQLSMAMNLILYSKQKTRPLYTTKGWTRKAKEFNDAMERCYKEITKLKNELSKKDKEIEELNGRIKELMNEIDKLRREIEHRNRIIEDRDKTIKELKDDFRRREEMYRKKIEKLEMDYLDLFKRCK